MFVLATLLIVCHGMLGLESVPRQLRYEKMHIRLAKNPIHSLKLVEGLWVTSGYYPGEVTVKKANPGLFWKSQWELFIGGIRICHKKNDQVGACDDEREENLESKWIIREREDETFVFKTLTPNGWYCMIYKPYASMTTIFMSLCEEGNPNQKFVIREAPKKHDPPHPFLPPHSPHPLFGYGPLEQDGSNGFWPPSNWDDSRENADKEARGNLRANSPKSQGSWSDPRKKIKGFFSDIGNSLEKPLERAWDGVYERGR